MSIVFATGSHPRHLFMARALARTGRLKALVIESREEHVPEPPAELSTSTRALFVRHFSDREAAEQRFFGVTPVADPLTGVETVVLSRDELNGSQTWSLLDRLQPELLLSYGVHKLTPETLAHAPRYRWNIHGGLSPWYRGVITHFWPSYFLQPQMTGMTLHETTEAIDGGDVVHQTVAPLTRGDGIHDLACRTVSAFADELPTIVAQMTEGRLLPSVRHSTTGRIWRASDWQPAHLHVIYELYQNRIVDRYLDGEFGAARPKTVRQFS